MRKNRFNKILAGTVLVLGLGIMTACGGSTDDGNAGGNNSQETSSDSSDTAGAELDFETKELADSIFERGEFKDDLAELSSDVALERLYALDSSKIEDSSFYTNTNATAEEIAVIKVNDPAYVQTVIEAYNQRVAEQKEACENYLPDEMPKLNDAVIESQGNYVVLCISMDSENAREIIGEYFGN